MEGDGARKWAAGGARGLRDARRAANRANIDGFSNLRRRLTASIEQNTAPGTLVTPLDALCGGRSTAADIHLHRLSPPLFDIYHIASLNDCRGRAKDNASSNQHLCSVPSVTAGGRRRRRSNDLAYARQCARVATCRSLKHLLGFRLLLRRLARLRFCRTTTAISYYLVPLSAP